MMPENIFQRVERMFEISKQLLNNLENSKKHIGPEKEAILEKAAYLTRREVEEMDNILSKLTDKESIESCLKENGIFGDSETIRFLSVLLQLATLRVKINVLLEDLVYERPLLKRLAGVEKMIEIFSRYGWALNYNWFSVLGFGDRLKIGWRKRTKRQS